MKQEIESKRRSFKPPFLMLAVLGVHVAALGFFMMMSGCQTRRATTENVEPPPAPVLPPQAVTPTPPVVAPPRPVMRPPVAADQIPETAEGAVYYIQKGDSLSKIAAKAGISQAELAELNKITDRNKIRIGQRLLLPAHARAVPQPGVSAASAPAPAAAVKSAAGPAVESGQTHVVVAGDTLGKIAARYGTSVAAFREINGLKSDVIRTGQKLKVPTGKKTASTVKPAAAVEPAPAPVAAPAPAPAPVLIPVTEAAPAAAAPSPVDAGVIDGEAPFPYTIKEGDTLESLAIKFGARKEVIMSLNNLQEGAQMRPGQKVLIPWQ